jgi:hypothetical protein
LLRSLSAVSSGSLESIGSSRLWPKEALNGELTQRLLSNLDMSVVIQGSKFESGMNNVYGFVSPVVSGVTVAFEGREKD